MPEMQGINKKEFSEQKRFFKSGGGVQNGSVKNITGPGKVSLGFPPSQVDKDWVALIR